MLSCAAFLAPADLSAYDRLGNISTRSKVLAGSGNEMIAGFIVQGTTTKCGVVRARGPSMNIAEGKLADPSMVVKAYLLQPNGTRKWVTIASNDDWKNQANAEDRVLIEDSGFAPSNNKEAAVYGCFDPNVSYTAIITGNGPNDEGIAIAEVFDSDSITEIQATGDTAALEQQINDLQNQVNSLAAMVTTLQQQAHNRYTDSEAQSAVGPHFSGNYNALYNRPALKPVATSGNYNDLTNKPALQTVAFTGSYYDLIDEPDPGTGTGTSHPALDYMSVNTSKGELIISGINVRIYSGGQSGKGNLIVGADDGCSGCTRTGKDNLIVGPNHEWKSTGGVIFGQNNAIDASWGSILGGAYNTLTGTGTGGSIVTGTQNWVMTNYGAILGGRQNETKNLGSWSGILGGQSNSANNQYETVWQ